MQENLDNFKGGTIEQIMKNRILHTSRKTPLASKYMVFMTVNTILKGGKRFTVNPSEHLV